MLTGKYSSAITLLIFILLLLPSTALSQFIYQDEPAISVLTDIQEKTGYRFLYRESLLANLSISIDANRNSLIDEVRISLNKNQLRLIPDASGDRFIVLPVHLNANQTASEYVIEGQVVDSKTGDRLPFSSISWIADGETGGTAASVAGSFSIQLPADLTKLSLTASFIGYEKETISIYPNNAESIRDITFRLSPEFILGSEIIVTGSHFYNPQNSALSGLIRTDRFSPMGDANAVRALQVLPAVQPATAINDGLSIRGSAPDGFHLELDGMKIFNQSHLFGLLDSFNGDAIRNSGFFYGVAPADEHTPAGGKLVLTTKNGSLNDTESTAGVSNTGIRATINGPLSRGTSSWLISGRISTMDELSWFNNDKIIQWGLDVDRPRSDITNQEIINSNLVTPQGSDVRFFDFHGKIYHESAGGKRTIFSTYLGGDRTSHLATRITRSNSLQDRFKEIDVETSNRWNNFATSVQHQRFISDDIFSNTLFGISAYETRFSKDDFIYTNFIRNSESLQSIVFTSPLSNKSTMNRFKFNQTLNFNLWGLAAKSGLQAMFHRGEYLEESFDRPNFYGKTTSFQTDIFTHVDWQATTYLDISTGIRVHHYSNGGFLKSSPRFSARLFNNRMISLHTGYSKNYQFVNRISFKNAVTADLWILADADQPPTSADQFTAGLEFKPFENLLIKTDVYRKKYENLRLHELNTSSLSSTLSNTPWYFQNSGEASGLESLIRLSGSVFSLTQTHTFSTVKLQNDLLNNGDEFYAPWDRRHAFGTLLEIPVTQSISLHASYTLATGTVDFLPSEQLSSGERLPDYRRLDLSASYAADFGEKKASVKFSVFNVTDRQNTWYREYQPVIFNRQTLPAIRAELVDVYDLGIQPSFELKLNF